LRPAGGLALADAPRPGHAERADGVHGRARDRAAAGAGRARGVAQLRRLRPPDPRPAQPPRAPDRPRPAGGRPLLPDRAPLPLQREVLPTLGAALRRLRASARLPAGGPGGAVGRGSAAEAVAALAGVRLASSAIQ